MYDDKLYVLRQYAYLSPDMHTQFVAKHAATTWAVDYSIKHIKPLVQFLLAVIVIE
jgi:hypothetical protein